MIEPDPSKRLEAIGRFESLAGLDTSDAEKLVDAALRAAVDQALETVMGSGSVPTALTAARADQLRYVCLSYGRSLTVREVGVLFRTIPSSARSILTTMTATYEEALHSQLVEKMQSDAGVKRTGAISPGFRYLVKFTQSSTYETAVSELERRSLLKLVDVDIEDLTLEFDVGDVGDARLKALGLSPPPVRKTR